MQTIVLCVLCVHLVGLVNENKLIKMHGVSNFKTSKDAHWCAFENTITQENAQAQIITASEVPLNLFTYMDPSNMFV